MNPQIEALRIPGELVERLSREARRCYPREACGFLLGDQGGAEARVRGLLAAENRSERADRFLIDARDVFEAMRAARDAGRKLLGVYHSHPDTTPDPSATDRADAWHEWLYLIISVGSSPPVDPLRSVTPYVSAVSPASVAPAPVDESRRVPNMACWRWDGEQFASVRLWCDAETGEVTW